MEPGHFTQGKAPRMKTRSPAVQALMGSAGELSLFRSTRHGKRPKPLPVPRSGCQEGDNTLTSQLLRQTSGVDRALGIVGYFG